MIASSSKYVQATIKVINNLQQTKNDFMRHIILLLLLIATLQVTAQDHSTRSAFRNGYARIGLNFLGNKLDNNLSPKANVLNGNLGTAQGICSEVGRNFYFNKNSPSRFRFGLDWTYLSTTYNKFDWTNYGKISGSSNTIVDGSSVALSFSGRLGPVVSFNPVEKLVIDARFQIAPSVYFFNHSFHKKEGQANDQYFEFVGSENGNNNADGESIKSRLSTGVKTSLGITIRRKAIGLALDYIPGKVKVSYDSNEGQGQEKIKANSLQMKLSFQL